MDEIHDKHGLRLIVENEEDCYTALGIVRGLWPEAPGSFKDYIAHPKYNGYVDVELGHLFFLFLSQSFGLFLSFLMQVPISSYCCSKSRLVSFGGSDSN